MPGCVKWLHGYGLKPIFGSSQSVPRPRVSQPTSARSPQVACRNPKRPSMTVSGPVRPARASSAAAMPECAAQPQWMRLTVPPVRFASSRPAPIDAEMAMAWPICSASRAIRVAAVAAAARAPQIDVACRPCSKKRFWLVAASKPAEPRRTLISMPIAAATIACSPVAPSASATASAAGMTLALGCSTLGRCVSSKSSVWASVPLTRAAAAAGSFSPEPKAVALPPLPQARATCSAMRAGS